MRLGLNSYCLPHIGIHDPSLHFGSQRTVQTVFPGWNKSLISFTWVMLTSSFYSTFRKALETLLFDLDYSSIIQKFSSVNKESYASLESLTNNSAVHAMKHTKTRSYSLKIVYVCLPKQQKNLKEYFLKFLTKEKIFKQRIAPRSRYE